MECGRRDVEVIVGAIRDGGEETRELRRRVEGTGRRRRREFW